MSEHPSAFEIVPPNALDFETHYQANRRELTRLAFLLLGEQAAAIEIVDEATIAFVRSGSERPPRLELARRVVARCKKRVQPTETQPESSLHGRFLALPIQQRCVIALDHLLQQDDEVIAQIVGRHTGSVSSLREDAMTALSLGSDEARSLPFDLRSIASHAETPDHWNMIDEQVRGASSEGGEARRRLLLPALLAAAVLAYLALSTGPTSPTIDSLALDDPSTSTTTTLDDDSASTTAPPPVATVQLLPGEQVLASDPLVVLGAPGPAPAFPLDDLGVEVVWEPIVLLSVAVERTVALWDSALGSELGGPAIIEKHTMVGQIDGRVVSTVWFHVDAAEPRLCVGLVISFELTSTTCRQGEPLDGQTFGWLLEGATETAYAPDGQSVTLSYLPRQASVVAAIDSLGTRMWQRPVGGVSIIPVNSEQPLAMLAVLDAAGVEMVPSSEDSG